MEETLGQRIERLRKKAQLGQKELGRRVGLSESAVSNLESGKVADLKLPVAVKMAAVFGITAEELHSGKPAATRQQLSEQRDAYDPDSEAAEIGRAVLRIVQEQQTVTRRPWRPGGSGSRRFPIINTVPASDATVRDSQLEDEIDIPDAFWVGATDPQVYRVTGECMALSGIISGDTIIIDAAKTEPREGQTVLAQVNGGLTLKRFYRAAGGVELRPNAPGYESIFVRPSEELIICGCLHMVFPTGER
jgi:SOS-response transcriptional repressor LexA